MDDACWVCNDERVVFTSGGTQPCVCVAWRAEVGRLSAALLRIANYDVRVEHGYTDEWTEAEAFEACQEIARSAAGATSSA